MAGKRQRRDCHDLRPATPAVCLSDLPDDLLGHILSFAPLKEAASTSALARRWRTLWLLSGALNLDSRSKRYSDVRCGYRRRFIFGRDRKAAMTAYGNSGFPIRKLTFYYDQRFEDDYVGDDSEGGDFFEILAKGNVRSHLNDLLFNPMAQHLEELYFGIGYDGGLCSFEIPILPGFRALRVLHITNCIGSHNPKDMVATFPRLTKLRLHRCHVSRIILQAIIDVSPLLNTLHLDQGSFSLCRESQHSLFLPKVTTLLLENFDYELPTGLNLELDAPNLTCFTYRGAVRPLSFKSPAPHITRVELHFNVTNVRRNYQRKNVACHLFWQFVSNFCSAKMLILRFKP